MPAACPRRSARCGPMCSSGCICKPGEVFLVQGGSSGIGVTAIQLAKAFGAKVLATAGSDEKCRGLPRLRRRCRDQLPHPGFRAVGKEFTNGRGVDAILDMVGGDYIPRQLDLLAHEGRLCFVALMGGSKVETDFGADPAQASDRHRLDPALAQRRSRRRRSSRRCGRRSGRCGRRQAAPVHLPAVPAGRGRGGASPDGSRASTSARSCWSRKDGVM